MKYAAAVVLLAIVLFGASTKADVEDCREAIRNFRTVRADVIDALRRYADCIASNDGHDDCSGEFYAVRSAQDDFEDAVSTYESECS